MDGAWGIQNRHGLSWWDSLIVAAAQLGGCRYLLTEDLGDGQRYDDLVVVNPFLHDPQSLS
jgi:predicted nucleic acid-binding protein